MNEEDLLAQAAAEAPKAGDNALAQLRDLGQKLMALDAEIADAELNLDLLKTQRRDLASKTLPEAMEAVGMKEFTLTSGERFSEVELVKASISKEKQDRAFEWLRSQGAGGLIKTKVAAEFGRGKEDEARRAAELLASVAGTVTSAQTVHPQTLGAFVRERLAEGKAVDMDLLGVFILREVEYGVPKAKKGKSPRG